MEKHQQYQLDLSPQSRWHIVSATAAARSNLLYLQEIGDFDVGNNYRTDREGFPSYLIKLTLAGSGILRYGGKTYEIPAGTLFWIDCMQPQQYFTDPAVGSWRVIWLHFHGANAKFYYDSFLQQTGGKPVASLAPGSPVYSVFRQLLELDYSEQAQVSLDLQISGLLSQLVSECVRAAMLPQAQAHYPKVVQEAYLYLTQNFEKQITLSELGARFGVSPFHLQKLFRRYIGLSPADCLIHLRIARAKELLRTTRDSIGTIANRIGMSSQNYFSLQFKKLEGITPLAYRKQWPQMEMYGK